MNATNILGTAVITSDLFVWVAKVFPAMLLLVS